MNVSRIAGQRVSSGRLLLAFAVVLTAAAAVLALGSKPFAPAHHPEPRAAFTSAPLAFEPNHGQTDAPVKFLARGAGYGLFLTSDQAVLKLEHFSGRHPSTDVVQMALAGANPNPQVGASDQLPGKSNYIIGNNPAQWHSNIPHYARVTYEQVYPGIDLVYYGKQGQLEYDFRVAPGAHVGLVGTNGVGKSTLLRILAGALQADEGEATLGGRVAYMPQDVGVAGEQRTVRELLLELADLRLHAEPGPA